MISVRVEQCRPAQHPALPLAVTCLCGLYDRTGAIAAREASRKAATAEEDP